MTDIEFSHFVALKKAVQDKYLEVHSPTFDDISKWKGIDIIYFQEDLRQKAKGNISEKTFYTYFKNNSKQKTPRIDMLNILSNYAGYGSWSEFKKKNPLPIQNTDPTTEKTVAIIEESKPIEESTTKATTEKEQKEPEIATKEPSIEIPSTLNEKQSLIKKYLWLATSAFLFTILLVIFYYTNIAYKKYTFTFIDADRNSSINAKLDVKIIRDDESPILFNLQPNSPFVYETKSEKLKMVISSPYYKTDTVIRDLTTAPGTEKIELKPNDFAIQLFYYSKSIKDFKKKTEQLNKLISDNALIYQVVDSDIYGIETMDKQKYISLVTFPTTSLENLEVIDSQMKNGKIVMIKFRITDNEKNK